METRLIILLSALLALLGRLPPASAQGTAFTYQGFLTDQGTPAHAIYDLRFRIYADASNGTVVAGPVEAGDVGVTNGLFTLRLDFGANVFNGSDRWLEIGLRPGTSTGAYTNVAPLQKITATPYAIRAAQFSGPVAASQITGTLAAANIGVGTITSSNLAAGAAAANLNSSGLSGVTSGGLVLSATENNAELVSAGYVKIGATTMSDVWQQRVNGTPPAARQDHTAVWTGSEMIVWGGDNGNNDGGRYDPALNTWKPLPTGGAPSARSGHTAVWTGSEMIVWGGESVGISNDGGRYRPAGNSWTGVTTNGAPAARHAHTAVWTGSEMIVWGGVGEEDHFDDGGRYNPVFNSWIGMGTATGTAPTPRRHHTAVWTGSEMIVWGGGIGGGMPGVTHFNDGARYNPSANRWTATTPNGTPAARYFHTAVWTGTEMIVWGGVGEDVLNDGGRYNPTANSWTAVSTAGAPSVRTGYTTVWTGSRMIVFGGYDGENPLSDGARYNPAANSWNAASNASVPRFLHTAVWTGSEMLVWGGAAGVVRLNNGERYNPGTDRWAGTATSPPAARSQHTAVWTGSEMIVWGGYYSDASAHYLNDGGRYNPAGNSWTLIVNTLPNTPAARIFHTAIWTGNEMIVWGGFGGFTSLNDGGRYHPQGNSWTAVSTSGAPTARASHTAVWTGNEMIVWGGLGVNNAGGRYIPAGNSWTAMSASSAPAARASHTAVWTGNEMIIWGGSSDGGGYVPDGGRYNPQGNSWTAVSVSGAPTARALHTAVWTGSEMFVWGGSNGGFLNDTFSYTPGRVLYLYQRP